MPLSASIQSAVLESMEHGYVFYNLDGKIAAFNQAACYILGVSVDQLRGKTSYDRDWHTIRENGDAFPPDLHPIMVSLKNGTPCFGVVMGIMTGTGVQRWLLINSDVVKIKETGEIVGAVASFSDITPQINQKKYLERLVEETRASARVISENTSHMKEALLSLAKDIASANSYMKEKFEESAAGPKEQAQLIEQRVKKLIELLSQKNAA